MRFAIVAARFNERITQRLVAGALGAFRAARLGPDAIEVHWVPGSFELAQAAGHLAATGRFAGIVCVGVVIRGQTPHFEHIAREAASGIRQVALEYGVPVSPDALALINSRGSRYAFEVVEYQKQRPRTDCRSDRRRHRLTANGAYAKRERDFGRHEHRIGKRSEFGKEHVVKHVDDFCGDGGR